MLLKEFEKYKKKKINNKITVQSFWAIESDPYNPIDIYFFKKTKNQRKEINHNNKKLTFPLLL